MNEAKFRKYRCTKSNVSYVIEEDLVGWYLIVYNQTNTASKDYLFDTLEDALTEAEIRFGIPLDKWQEIL